MKVIHFISTILFLNLIVFYNTIEIKAIEKKSDFEDIIFKSDKEWLIVVYANWDHNQQIWKDLWEYVRLDFEKDEYDIEMGKFDVANEIDRVPNMDFLKKIKSKGLPSIIYIPEKNKTWDNIENFDSFYSDKHKDKDYFNIAVFATDAKLKHDKLNEEL